MVCYLIQRKVNTQLECDDKFFSCKHCKFLNEQTLDWEIKLWRPMLACGKGNSISWYTGIYFNGLHYGRQERDMTWSNRSILSTLVM